MYAPTVKASGVTDVLYDVSVPGFSYFAIAGVDAKPIPLIPSVPVVESPTAVAAPESAPVVPVAPATESPSSLPTGSSRWWLWVLGVVVFVGLLGGLLFLFERHRRPPLGPVPILKAVPDRSVEQDTEVAAKVEAIRFDEPPKTPPDASPDPQDTSLKNRNL